MGGSRAASPGEGVEFAGGRRRAGGGLEGARGPGVAPPPADADAGGFISARLWIAASRYRHGALLQITRDFDMSGEGVRRGDEGFFVYYRLSVEYFFFFFLSRVCWWLCSLNGL